MEKYIPYEKLSKKEKRKLDLARRNTWGELNPVTRKPQNSKAYNRKSRRTGSGSHHLQPATYFYAQITENANFLLLLTHTPDRTELYFSSAITKMGISTI